MRRALLGLLAFPLLVAPLWADVTMKQNLAGRGMGMGAATQTVTYIKGFKMRSDATLNGTTRTTIFDVEHQKMYIFDSKKKEVDVWNMADFTQQLGAAADTSGMTASFKANGQTKAIAGKTAAGYDMSISLPTHMGDPKNGMAMTVTLSGPTWIVKGAPGSADFQKFYRAAAEKGFIFTDPRAAKAQSGQAKATTEMYRQMAATGGIPYETEMNIKMSGEGPMASMMSKMGNLTMTTTVESIEVGALADDLFQPPAGYKVNEKK